MIIIIFFWCSHANVQEHYVIFILVFRIHKLLLSVPLYSLSPPPSLSSFPPFSYLLCLVYKCHPLPYSAIRSASMTSEGWALVARGLWSNNEGRLRALTCDDVSLCGTSLGIEDIHAYGGERERERERKRKRNRERESVCVCVCECVSVCVCERERWIGFIFICFRKTSAREASVTIANILMYHTLCHVYFCSPVLLYTVYNIGNISAWMDGGSTRSRSSCSCRQWSR